MVKWTPNPTPTHHPSLQKITGEPGSFEQSLACGVDADGREVKTIRFVSQLSQVLLDTGLRLSNELKLRFLLLYFCSIANVPESSRKQLLDAARLNDAEVGCVLNLFKSGMLDVPYHSVDADGGGGAAAAAGGRKQGGARGRFGKSDGGATFHRVGSCKEDIRRYKQVARSARFDLSRFQPRVRQIFEGLLANGLCAADFPAVAGGGGGPGARVVGAAATGAGTWRWRWTRWT